MSHKEVHKELEKMTATKLREEAAKYPEIKGAHGMAKEELIEVIKQEKIKAGELVVEEKKEKVEKTTQVKFDKSALKKQIKTLKEEKSKALSGKDKVKIKQFNNQIKSLKRKLRRQAVAKKSSRKTKKA